MKKTMTTTEKKNEIDKFIQDGTTLWFDAYDKTKGQSYSWNASYFKSVVVTGYKSYGSDIISSIDFKIVDQIMLNDVINNTKEYGNNEMRGEKMPDGFVWIDVKKGLFRFNSVKLLVRTDGGILMLVESDEKYIKIFY